MRVLIVDDEESALSNFLFEIIEYKNLDYFFVKDNPILAIEYAKENEIEGAFLDISMPNMNGIDLAKKLIQIRPKIKIAFITAYSYDELKLKAIFNSNLIGVCNKPYESDDIIHMFSKMRYSDKKDKIVIKTFGSFDIYINDELVRFSSNKSKELAALAICYNGQTLTMSDAICHLWPDKDLDLAKRLYRDAIWRLRKALDYYNLNSLFLISRAQLVLNRINVECDYFNYLKGDKNLYKGRFLVNYDWSIEYQMNMDKNQ